jgi:glycosyltransferase involved in cell wall biosynthesis
MRILQIVTQMEAGGAQKVAWLLADGLRQRGHESELWFIYRKRATRFDGADLRCLYPARPHPGMVGAIARRLFQEFAQKRFDALITHTHYANVICQPVAALAGIPVRIAVHHNPAPTFPPPARWLDAIIGSTAIYTHSVSVSNVTRNSFAAYPPSYRRKHSTIFNGLKADARHYNYDLHDRRNIPTGARIVVNVGRLAPQKNQSLLLKALARVPNAWLVIVGEGELHRQLIFEALLLGIADRVLFTGELPRDEVSRIVHAADVFVLPSRWEAMPMAALEAMSAGRPIVAADIPALRETLGDAMEPFTCEDPVSLAAAIHRLLDDPFAAAQRAQNALKRSREFSLETMVARYAELIESASQAASTPRPANEWSFFHLR